jgi:replicative DNA helicase
VSRSDELSYDGFKPSTISKDILVDRLDKTSHGAVFTGVKVIDDVFGGILNTDIVLLGAKTGAGKTGLAAQIALYNAQIGKRVYMFALEAEKDEIEMRIIYELVVGKAMSVNPKKKYNYKHWRLGRYKELSSYYQEAMDSVKNFENFKVFYREKEFGVQDFIKHVMVIKEDSDLIIVDHIHYFDLQGENENRALSDAIKKIRDVALIAGVPIVLLAHLRKSANTTFKLVPDIDDFHGSSDLTKVCTKAVIVAPGGNSDNGVDTFFSFPKFRGFSAPSKYLFKCRYDIYKNTYDTDYTIYDFKYNNVQFKFADNLVNREKLTWLG